MQKNIMPVRGGSAFGGRKIFIIIAILALTILGAQPSLAFTTSSVINLQAPYATFYRATFDGLIMDFTLNISGTDTLNALGLKNLGTANYLSHIKYMTLWADDGPAGFQGMGVDRVIGNFNYTTTYESWYIQNLNESASIGKRFFVSVETFSDYTSTATILMQIPILTDNNANGLFDVGDFGVFTAAKNNGPTDDNVTNANSQVVSTYSIDMFGPKLVITNLFDGQILNTNSLMIQGMARDEGGSYIRDFNIFIDGQEYPVQEMDVNFYTWRYDWENISDGTHTISLQAHDGWGNFTQTGSITVSAHAQTFSVSNSSVAADKIVLANDGLDKSTITVTIKDSMGQPLPNKQIVVDASSGVIITIPNNNSDVNGKIIFEARSTSLGVKTVSVKVDNQVIGTLSITINAPGLVGANISYGDLIKASGPAVYYYATDGKRYVFPTLNTYLTWYPDFSTVKTITDAQLAAISIGGNVTYKPGVKLIKITTDPKVYAVDAHGTLRWIKTEALAKALYGDNWATLVQDVADAFFVNYNVGADIALVGDFSPLTATANATSISEDKIVIVPHT
ncbi:MAG: Ig-like domain-containing protein [Patescibacteria group bacterium]|nr:Ig-like domain-containing protein [Patescibacteria group bacterium]